MKRGAVGLSVPMVIAIAFSIRISVARGNELVKRRGTLEIALTCHQRFLEDAQARGVLIDGHAAALGEFRQTVETLRQVPEEQLSREGMDPSERALSRLEAEFIPQESMRIVQQEREEQAQTLSLLPSAERAQWRPGVSALSFGRFGRWLTDGLLCDTVAFESIKTTTAAVELGRTTSADREVSTLGCDMAFPETAVGLSLAPEGVESVTARFESLNWIGKTLRISTVKKADVGKDLGTVHTTLQRPATRFFFSVRRLKIRLRGFAPDRSALIYLSGAERVNVALSMPGKVAFSKERPLDRPWVLLDLADEKEDQRVAIVLQLQHRLREIEIGDGTLVLAAENGKLENVWVFRLWGVERKKTSPATQPSGDEMAELVKRIDGLCGLNLAWPTACREYYRVDSANEAVAIRNDVEFETCADDWGTPPQPQTAVPPLIMMARGYGMEMPVKGDLHDWRVPTKYGTFATVKGPVLEYTLPIPPLYRHGLFVAPGDETLTRLASQWAGWGGKGREASVDLVYVGLASAYQAWCYVKQDKRPVLEEGTPVIKALLQPDYWWKRFKWRMEPLSGRRYCLDYPYGHYWDSHVMDINWGNMLVMYGVDQWAAHRDHWADLDEAWPRIWALTEYLAKSHDWAWMADSITEMGEGSAIDCLTAAHVGWVAAVRMTRMLNKEREADQAAYLCAKTALCHAMRFAYLEYVQRYDLWHSDSPDIGTVNGFHEFDAFIHPKHDPPWWGACSLSGYGVQPETFDTAFAYIGTDRMRPWWDMVERIYPEWYWAKKPYPKGTIYEGNSCYVTHPVIYLNLYLGAEDAKLVKWMKDSEGKWAGNFQGPNVIAEILSRHVPVRIADWGRCTFDQARWSPDERRAEVAFANPTTVPQTVRFLCGEDPQEVFVDQAKVESRSAIDRWKFRTVCTSIPPGTHAVQLRFAKEN